VAKCKALMGSAMKGLRHFHVRVLLQRGAIAVLMMMMMMMMMIYSVITLVSVSSLCRVAVCCRIGSVYFMTGCCKWHLNQVLVSLDLIYSVCV